MVIGGLALIAVGGWLFVSGRQSAGRESLDTACADGSETWRSEGAARTFLVPIAGAKISAASTPALDALQAYVDGWRGFDAGGTATDSPSPGIPPSAFAGTDQGTWLGLFSSIETSGGPYELDFDLPLQEVAVRCQRRYACVGGQWIAQAATRAVESAPSPTPTSLTNAADRVSTMGAVDLAMRAVAAWKAAEQADLERAAFVAGCR